MDAEPLALRDGCVEAPRLLEAEHWLGGVKLPKTVAVGWSGGVDSTALLLALHTCGYDVRAWHVDHGWRPDSARQATLLRQRAAEWGISYTSERVEIASEVNREAASRHARYRLFSIWAAEQGVDVLCLAHHLDDQAETVCMRMLQGAGVAGCRGMQGQRVIPEGPRLLRPLLHLPKSMLQEALHRAGVTWLEDASNWDTSLLRNHIRHRLFPAMRRAGAEPSQLWLRWQCQAERLAGQLDESADAVPLEEDSGVVSVSWNAWVCQPAPVRACLLQRMVKALFGPGASLGRRHIMLVERWLTEGGRGGVDLSRSRLSRRNRRLRLEPAGVRLCRLAR